MARPSTHPAHEGLDRPTVPVVVPGGEVRQMTYDLHRSTFDESEPWRPIPDNDRYDYHHTVDGRIVATRRSR